MASNSILKLQVDDKQYEASLKSAQQGLQALMNALRNSGKSFSDLDKNTEKYVRVLGNMEATAKTTRGRIGEMSSAFVELSQVEKQLTDQERQSPVGKALTESLNQLKQRTIEAKQELADLDKQLTSQKAPATTGGLFSGIGSKMEGALAVFGGNLMTKAAGAIANLGSEMYGMVQQGIELAKAGEGIRIAFERLGRGDLLDGLREATHGTVTDLELMKAAVKFNDFKLPVEELGTMLAFAQQKAKDTGQSVDYMVDSIVTGLGRKSLMILDNLGLSASEIKEKMAETGDMTKAVGEIIREQMSKAGDYVETAADRAAQANVSLQNKMEELGRKFAPLEEASSSLWTSMKIGILDVVGGPLARLLNGLTEAGRMMNAYGKMGGSGKVGRMTANLAGAREGNRQSIYQQQQERFWRYINPREQMIKDIRAWQRGERGNALSSRVGAIAEKYGMLDATKIQAEVDAAKKMLSEYQQAAKQYLNPVKANVDTKGLGGSSTSKGRNTAKKEQTELQQNQTRINDLTQQYVSLMAAASEAGKPLTDEQQKQTSEIQRQISELEKRNGQLKLYQEQAQGKLLGPDAFRQQLSVDVAVNNKKIEELEKQLLSLNGITIDPKTVTITATDEALPKLREIQGITIDDKTVAITAEDKTQPEFREVESIRLKGKKVTVTADTMEALKAVQGINGITIDPKTVTITATDEALPKLREIQGITIDDKTMTITAETQEALQALQGIEGVTIDTKTVTITATDDALPKLREIDGITIDDKTMTVTAETADALRALQGIDGVTINPKTVTITATDEALPKLREIEGITIDDKMMTVTAETADALRALQGINGITIDPKTVTITATDEALPKLREIDGITIDDKAMTVTADTQEALQALQAVDGVTIDTKNIKVTAETDEARQKVEELKRQIAELKDQNLMINAGMASLDLQNARDLSRTGGVTGFVGTGKSAMPVEGLPSMSDVVRERGGNLLDDKAMKAVNEDISRNLPKAKEKDSPLESGKKLLGGINQLTDGLEKIGIDIPDEIQSVISVIQGVMQVIEAVNTIIGGAQTTALTANTVAMGVLTEALWANTALGWFSNGGIVPHAASGYFVGGNNYSGDVTPIMANAGELILNKAQQGNLASQLEGGAFQNLKLDAVISGEQIRLVLNNNGRRTGRGEYVQSTRRR